jgi:hypothetical protein
MRRLPPRLLLLVAPVCGAGLVIALAAAVSFALTPHDFGDLAGPLALIAASTVASRYPVPIEGAESGGVTLSFVFGTSGIVLFGWETGILIAVAAPATMQLFEHRPFERVAFNASVFAIGAALAAGLVALVDGSGTGHVVAQVALSAAAQYTLNLLLVSAAVARSTPVKPCRNIDRNASYSGWVEGVAWIGVMPAMSKAAQRATMDRRIMLPSTCLDHTVRGGRPMSSRIPYERPSLTSVETSA